MLIRSFFLIAALFTNITDKVTVKGLVEHPFEITISNINAFKPEMHKDLKIIGSKGDVKKTFNTFKGVSLKRILDSAKISMPDHKERGKYYIAVKASDGYTSLYSWNDIFNNPTGDHVFLVFEVNGKPIEEDGKFVMVCSNDKITGARHVKWVQEIEVGKLP